MVIKKYNHSDKKRILELLKMNTPLYFSPNEEKDLVFYLDNYAQNYFVVEIDGLIEASGGINFTEDGSIGKISWDIVNPTYQGKGLGSLLMKFRIDKLKETEGIERISVRTSQLAFKFYEKFGLEIREIVQDYWDKGFDLYRLDCSIYDVLD